MRLLPHRPGRQKKTKESKNNNFFLLHQNLYLSNTIATICRTEAGSHFWWTGLRVGRKRGIAQGFPPNGLPLGTLAARRADLISGNSKTRPMAEATALGHGEWLGCCWMKVLEDLQERQCHPFPALSQSWQGPNSAAPQGSKTTPMHLVHVVPAEHRPPTEVLHLRTTRTPTGPTWAPGHCWPCLALPREPASSAWLCPMVVRPRGLVHHRRGPASAGATWAPSCPTGVLGWQAGALPCCRCGQQ